MKKRRQFFKTALGVGMATLIPTRILANSQPTQSIIKIINPKALKKGDTIGLIAPGYAIKPEILLEAKETLEKMGFIPFHTHRILGNHGYFSNSDTERAADLNEMFANKNVDGILCARGGTGVLELCI